MNEVAQISAIEKLIASDPGGRHVGELVVPEQLHLAAQSLMLARRVGIVSGFFIPDAGASETDGPPGAKAVGVALRLLGQSVDFITDRHSVALFRALDLEPIIEPWFYLDDAMPTHLIAIERLGRCADGRYRNMHGVDVSASTEPLDDLFLAAGGAGVVTIGIGDGGNEIGMGKIFAERSDAIDRGVRVATTIPTDFCIAAGVSNWGAYGLVAALSVLAQRNLLPSTEELVADIERCVARGVAVDGRTGRREPTVDGLDLSISTALLSELHRQIT